MSDWQEVRLRDLCDTVDYGLTASASTNPDGPKFLRITDIVGGIRDWKDVPHVRATSRDRQKYALAHGDIVIARTGATTGHSQWIDHPPESVFASYLIRLKVRPGTDSRFLGYALKHEQFWNYVRGVLGDKSAQPNASATTLTNVMLRVPSRLVTQQAIAKLLGALDDKIAANDRVVRKADELRSLLLANWLVATGRGIARPLSSLAQFVNGRAFTKNATGSGRMVVRIADINSGPGQSTVYSEIDVPDEHVVRPGDVLFAWSGSLTVARWFRPEAIVNQHIFKVIPRTGLPTWLVYEMVFSALARFRGIAADKATTMGHIQRHHLDESVWMPPDGDIAELDAHLGPLWDRSLAAEQESLRLRKLGDGLLPRLMSGEIRVREAEEDLEEVL